MTHEAHAVEKGPFEGSASPLKVPYSVQHSAQMGMDAMEEHTLVNLRHDMLGCSAGRGR